MKIQEIKTQIYRLKFKFNKQVLTGNNIFIATVVFFAVIWVWGNISVMEKNYSLQKKLELKKREQLIGEIEYETLKYEQKYLKSTEYQELAARSKLGLADKGEKVLILDKYPEETKKENKVEKQSNFKQWVNFLFGGNAYKSSTKQ
ncbi:hypothetical protein [Candidatus Nanogingivalis gingivitcus]|uniref:Septum formation initiator n=1 Tax=Candidatus Nanogingivalis gingivitcus TaxID=2171992 RepID=A0ABY0FJD3_9BACT|nr:hypothetical protein [Candidatus Nanogingivalis gingivitcus]RYC73027.1 hypothetical protein G6CMJM_00134 [Candidatus Nanogingivalis gingivitcus]